jgi:hypothetical protein
VSFIDQHKEEYGVGSVCSVLPIAPQPTTSIRGAGDSLRAAQLGTSATTSCNQRFSGVRGQPTRLRRQEGLAAAAT